MIYVRFLLVHNDLVVPEAGTVFYRDGQAPSGACRLIVPGIDEQFLVTGEVAAAVWAYAKGEITFPVREQNGRVVVDLPGGWQAAEGARRMAGPEPERPIGPNLTGLTGEDRLEAALRGDIYYEGSSENDGREDTGD